MTTIPQGPSALERSPVGPRGLVDKSHLGHYLSHMNKSDAFRKSERAAKPGRRKNGINGTHAHSEWDRLADKAMSAEPVAFSISSIGKVADRLGVHAETMAQKIGLSRTTYHRRLAADDTLDTLQSDALAKYIILVAQAVETFDGDLEASQEWLSTPQHGLGNQLPLEYARTTVGFREVEKLLTRINYGVYA